MISPFAVSSRLRGSDRAAAISDVVLPGLRTPCTEERASRPKEERAIDMRDMHNYMHRQPDYVLFCNTCFHISIALTIIKGSEILQQLA